ncbi:MAG: AgmX/PglI C-terminal domain-containing protein [Desulfuromonadales bacterium]|nr:AgmX/PglI C-terminal domain-containing protein [Desulfuromonadales bacterium]
MSAAKTSLAAELAPLQTQIEQTRGEIRLLEGELRTVLTENESFSADKQRFDALRDVCTALDALGNLGASRLFWEELLDEDTLVADHLGRLRGYISEFEEEIRGTQEKHASLKAQINKRQHDLNFLDEEVRQAHAREERRNDELLIERKASPIPYRSMVMPWNNQGEVEKRFRLALLVALLFCISFGTVIPLWKLPVRDRSAVVVVPERLAMLVKKEQPKPEKLPERPKEEKKPEKEQDKVAEQPKEDRPKSPATTVETQNARKKAESTGVLAFKEAFSDLMEETPVARLGLESNVSAQSGAAGQAQASRSMVAMQSSGGGGSSGGISNSAVSRNIGTGGGGGGNRLGGVAFARVESTVAGLKEEARPLTTGTGPARTDEEIQIVFDKYKATLYRIYNTELRKNPTLRGKIILRITIEPGGEVSACSVQSSDLASPELVAQIVERVKKINFGPKEKVPRTTIMYPIDFLPAG